MILKRYNQIVLEKYDDQENDLDVYGRPNYSSKPTSGEKNYNLVDDYEEDIQSEDMENLRYLLRTMFRNSGVEVDVESKGMDIMIYAVLNQKEKINNILKIFDVVKKLKKDILPQYDSEFEIWETKSGHPMLTFNFYYEDADGDDNAPF